MSSIISLIWKLVKIWGYKLVELFYRLIKAQIRALLWKYGIMFCLMIAAVALAIAVLRS